MNLRDWFLRLRALMVPRRVERELDEELAFHLEREAQKHIAQGASAAEARTQARARFGSVPLTADQCRDARGTAFFDALVLDIRYAFTMFRRAPLVALTIVGTVALGLGLVTVVFTFYDALFLRTDAVRNPAELFEVQQPPMPGAKVWESWTRLDYDALRGETSVFADAFAMLPGVDTRVDGRTVSGTLVTGNFFQVLGVNAALGRILLPDDDQKFAGRPVLVLSHAGWTRLLADDPAAVGRSLTVNGTPYTVIGVMPPGFHGLATSSPDYWAPLDLLGRFHPALAGKEDQVTITVAGRLKPGLSREAATTALTSWAAANPRLRSTKSYPKTIFLKPTQAPSADVLEGLLRFSPLFFAFGLILMVGCANVANLLLARGISRQREIGVRLSLGASRRRIIRQLLTESLLLALAAAACGFGVSRLMLEAGASAAGATMPPEMAEQVSLVGFGADWWVVAFLLGGAVVSTVSFGLAPALQATRLELVRTMRGELTRDARPSRARGALVALQVSASAMLLICAAVFLRSALAAASVKPGLRTADTMLLDMANEPLRPAMLQAVRADPSIAAVAASWPGGVRGALAEASVSVADGAKETSATIPVEYMFVSPEYFGLLDIQVLRGRGLTPEEGSAAAGVVVVSETTARRLWPDRDAIGQVVSLDAHQRPGTVRLGFEGASPQLPFNSFTVVGVVADVRLGLGRFQDVGAGVYVPISAESAGTSLVLRVHGDPDQVRQRLIGRLTQVDPAMGRITTMRAIAGGQAYVLKIAFWVTVGLAGLALALTVSGLFSVLSYLVEQRSTEIGVRMALGATPRHVARLVLSQSVRPVVLGLVAGGGSAGLLATVLMASSASRIQGIVRVFDPLAYVASLVLVVTACLLAASIPAFRAASIDPIATLRNE